MLHRLKAAILASALSASVAPAVSAQDAPIHSGPTVSPEAEPVITLFTLVNLGGDWRELREVSPILQDLSFNNRTASLVVLSGTWEICEEAEFRGRCALVRRNVHDLARLGLRYKISSVRPIHEYTDAPHGLIFDRDDEGRIRYADTGYGYGHDRLYTDVYVFYGRSRDYHESGYYHPHVGYGPFGFRARHSGRYDDGFAPWRYDHAPRHYEFYDVYEDEDERRARDEARADRIRDAASDTRIRSVPPLVGGPD